MPQKATHIYPPQKKNKKGKIHTKNKWKTKQKKTPVRQLQNLCLMRILVSGIITGPRNNNHLD